MTDSIGNYDHKADRAFWALFFYEINCISKYDIPGRPSRIPAPGEKMSDFASRYGTTVDDMKRMWLQVERYMDQLEIKHT